MELEFVGIETAITDFIEDSGFGENERLDENLLIKWATDCRNFVDITELLVLKVVIIPIQNTRGRLPNDFRYMHAVAGNPWPDKKGKKTKREQIVQWIQRGVDCDLEINLKCNQCGETSCDCNAPFVEVDVDRIWEQANPWVYFSHYKHLAKIHKFGTDDRPDHTLMPKFELLRAASNDFFNAKYRLGDCPNVNCTDCKHSFLVDRPFIEVDFSCGEVLLSYLAKKTDENGDVLIPDHPDMHAAIQHHLNYKFLSKEARENRFNPTVNWQVSLAMAKEEMMLREDALGKFRTAVTMPSFLELKNWLETSWMARIPNYHAKDNLNKVGKGQYERYKDRIERGSREIYKY